MLFLLHASMISSDGFAPYKLVSFKVQSSNHLVKENMACEWQQKLKYSSSYLMLLVLLRTISEISHLGG